MKTYAIHIIAVTCVFSFNCFGQQAHYIITNPDTQKTPLQFEDKSKENLVINSYHVKEIINLPFGKKRITEYEVSKLDMIDTYDLGPNNIRTVTAIYKRVKTTEAITPLQTSTITSNQTITPPQTSTTIPTQTIKPLTIQVSAPSYSNDSVNIDILDIYTNVVNKGYRSIDMLKKVADKYYFENNFTAAAKYYLELFSLEESSEPAFYLRCAKSLKAINQPKKAAEIIKLFENKTAALAMSKK